MLGPAGEGFTQSGRRRALHRAPRDSRAQQPKFARAWAALAAGYLSVGGKDLRRSHNSRIASAERALSIDDDVAAAHAALGLVHLRRNDWVAALEQLDRALMLDANSAPALEGTACLLADAGQYAPRRLLIEQAVRSVAKHRSARMPRVPHRAPARCTTTSRNPPVAAARVQALRDSRRRVHGTAVVAPTPCLEDFDGGRIQCCCRGGSARSRSAAAITLAANEEQIDSTTEILCGAALRRGEFVFNRMARLQRQREQVPLRVLWMPQTAFLRSHARFEEIVSTLACLRSGRNTACRVCAAEPKAYGCKTRPQGQSRNREREPQTRLLEQVGLQTLCSAATREVAS